jgi:hypothetical protein
MVILMVKNDINGQKLATQLAERREGSHKLLPLHGLAAGAGRAADPGIGSTRPVVQG